MATYNRAHFIVETLNSILAQTYVQWECLIIDDGSTDDTLEVLGPILKADNRFKYYKRPETYKKGLPGSRNYGLDLAKGDYIVFFDDDDIVHPLCLEISVSVLKHSKHSSFCNFKKAAFFGKFDYGSMDTNRDYNLEFTGDNLLEGIITQKIPFASCTVLWKKECFNDVSFNEDLMYAEEWECYQRIVSNKHIGILLDKILYYNRKHDKSNTGEFWKGDKVRVKSKKEAIKLVVENLYKKKLLTPSLFKYLMNYAISFRDYKLVKNILIITNPEWTLRWFYKLKYVLFPGWVLIKRAQKKLMRFNTLENL
jgi:GalNAc5-diNAcBac-PP-undecaprenol beta-1,3-glucosyltransferase